MAPMTKRRKLDQPEEISFDLGARQDYLSGYHRRKQARKLHAREVAIKKEKEEKTKERRELREQRKEDLESHVKAVNAELKKQNRILDGRDDADVDDEDDTVSDSSDKFEGFEEEQKATLPEDDEFVDEDKYTTVTVEAMEQSGEDDAEDSGPATKSDNRAENLDEEVAKPKRIWTKNKPIDAGSQQKHKKRKTKFRYESKSERAATKKKQKAKNAKAASARRSRD